MKKIMEKEFAVLSARLDRIEHTLAHSDVTNKHRYDCLDAALRVHCEEHHKRDPLRTKCGPDGSCIELQSRIDTGVIKKSNTGFYHVGENLILDFCPKCGTKL